MWRNNISMTKERESENLCTGIDVLTSQMCPVMQIVDEIEDEGEEGCVTFDELKEKK